MHCNSKPLNVAPVVLCFNYEAHNAGLSNFDTFCWGWKVISGTNYTKVGDIRRPSLALPNFILDVQCVPCFVRYQSASKTTGVEKRGQISHFWASPVKIRGRLAKCLNFSCETYRTNHWYGPSRGLDSGWPKRTQAKHKGPPRRQQLSSGLKTDELGGLARNTERAIWNMFLRPSDGNGEKSRRDDRLISHAYKRDKKRSTYYLPRPPHDRDPIVQSARKHKLIRCRRNITHTYSVEQWQLHVTTAAKLCRVTDQFWHSFFFRFRVSFVCASLVTESLTWVHSLRYFDRGPPLDSGLSFDEFKYHHNYWFVMQAAAR